MHNIKVVLQICYLVKNVLHTVGLELNVKHQVNPHMTKKALDYRHGGIPLEEEPLRLAINPGSLDWRRIMR